LFLLQNIEAVFWSAAMAQDEIDAWAKGERLDESDEINSDEEEEEEEGNDEVAYTTHPKLHRDHPTIK